MISEKPKVLFVIKQRVIEGTLNKSYGLVNSCEFVSRMLLSEYGIESKVVCVIDSNFIDREIALYQPTHCFIEALWTTPLKLEILCNLHPSVKFQIRIHSQTPFLVTEGISFQWISEYLDLQKRGYAVTVSSNSTQMVSDLQTLFSERYIGYTPNVYHPLVPPQSKELLKALSSDEIHIGCFGALRPLKNHCNQAVWALKFARLKGLKLFFHINRSEAEASIASPILKNLRSIFKTQSNAELVEHPWLNHSDFLSLVSQMDIGMQVSFSETFNIVAADFVWMHKPLIVSSDIAWCGAAYKVDLFSERSVLEGLSVALESRTTHKHTINYRNLLRVNAQAARIWHHELNK